MQEGHATARNAPKLARHSSKSEVGTHKTAKELLSTHQINPTIFLSLQNVSCDDMPATLNKKSYDELAAIKSSLEQFFEKYKNDKNFQKHVSKIKKVGIYEEKKVGKKKRLKPWKSRPKIPALKLYANLAYKTVLSTLQQVSLAAENLCRDVLKTKVSEATHLVLRRFIMGVKQAGIDIESVLHRKKFDGPCYFARDLLQKAKTQPIRETLGDVTQLLSRATINATAVFVAVSAIAVTIETGVAAATGTLGAIAAQKFFEPLSLSINLDGTVAVETAASSGVSVWQAIATSIAPAVQAFAGVVEQAGHLFCALDKSGNSTANLSKGTTLPRNLEEQLAVEEVRSHPSRGLELDIKMTDPRWPASEGWVKMHYMHGTKNNKIVVHYVYNKLTGATNDFKIKVL